MYAIRLAVVLSFVLSCSTITNGMASEDAKRDLILRALSKAQGGVIVHLGCGDGSLTAALRTNDRFLVHGLDTNFAGVQRARENVLRAGDYGNVSVAVYDGRHLPYSDNMVNLLVASRLDQVDMSEVMRVLVPGGAAYVNKNGTWETCIKPWSTEMGQWSHHLHGADGNPVTPDRLVDTPKRLKWLAGPKWQRAHDTDANVNALVSAGGRVFYMVDEAPIGLPGDNDTSAIKSAHQTAGLKPDFVRIYPTVVLAGSPLANRFEQNKYTPLSLKAAVSLAKKLYLLFKTKNISVTRMGLQATEDFADCAVVKTGPFHPAFGHLVLSEIFLDKATALLNAAAHKPASMTFSVNPRSVSRLQGIGGHNLKILKQTFSLTDIRIVQDASLSEDDLVLS